LPQDGASFSASRHQGQLMAFAFEKLFVYQKAIIVADRVNA
jgi:hypothetical protein